MKNSVALIVIDMQVGAFESKIIPPIAEGNQLLVQVNKLITKARNMSVPIIFIQHSGGLNNAFEQDTVGWHIHPTVAPITNELVIQKSTPDSFHNTRLQNELKSLQIKKLVIAGLQTEYCIDTTCRRAFSLGYKVILAKDAHSTWDTDKLSAKQIIEHHNIVLGEWFADLKEVSHIDFSNL